MTKIQPTRADTTLTKSNRRKMKLHPNNINNPRTEIQNPNDKATTEINPTDKNSNDIIPSGHKRNDNNKFSAVTRGNSNPEQSPDVCNKQARSKRFQETSIPSTTGGAPPNSARISAAIFLVSLLLMTLWSGQTTTRTQSVVQRWSLRYKHVETPTAERLSTSVAAERPTPKEREVEEIIGEEEEPNRRVSRRTVPPTPMATVQLTVFKSEQVYLDAEVFPINAGYELHEEDIQLQVWDVWLQQQEIGRNIWEEKPVNLTSVLVGVLLCNQTATATTKLAVRRKISPVRQIARQPPWTRGAADLLTVREDDKCEEEEENHCQEVGRDDWPANHPVLFCDTALCVLVVRSVPARCLSNH